MLKHIAFFSIISFLVSCHEQTTHPDYAALIKGNWIGKLDTITFYHDKTNYLSFDDSTSFGSYWVYSDYQVQKDTLYIKGLADYEKGRINRYTILQLTADSLTLLTAKHDSNNHIPDTIILSKIRAKNNISPSSVYFASSGCFGECPMMYLEIDSSLNFLFYGAMYTNKTGGFRGKISRSEYEYILNQVHNLPLSSLQEFYDAPWTDDQTLGIAITNKDTVIKSVAYGHYQEPMELHLLLSNLLEIYKTVPLHADSSVTAEYFSTHSQNDSINRIIFPPKVPAPTKYTTPKIKK